jgi:hypothetical protein
MVKASMVTGVMAGFMAVGCLHALMEAVLKECGQKES